MIITLDIETIPTQRADILAYVASQVTHPGNITKAETIAKWNEESRPAAVAEALHKTALDGAFGQVVCVGIAMGDNEPETFSEMSENTVLLELSDSLDRVSPKDFFSTVIVGHNVSGFDLRFLVQRYIVNGIKPHPVITRAAQAKPWESDKVYDTMVQFAGVGNRISLDKLCMALGLLGKGDVSGKDVWPMVQAGELQKVAEYCAGDVRKTRAVYNRMVFSA